MSKFLYRQERLDFASGWVSKETDLVDTPVATVEARTLLSSGDIAALVALLDDTIIPQNSS